MVESGAVGTFRRDAAARGRDEPGRHRSWGGDAVAARNARRLRPAAACAADGTPHLGQRSREHDGVARESFAKSAEIDIRPPLLVAAFLLALLDLIIAYALRGLLRRRPIGVAA